MVSEEILASNRALWFSPSDTHLAYVHFNDSLVKEIRLPLYEHSPTKPYTR